MNDKQKLAYEWAKNQCYSSVAAQHAKTLVRLVDELTTRAETAEAELAQAVEDIFCADRCDVCKFSHDGSEDCEKYDFDCQACKSEKCVCRTCRNEDKWQWRGLRKE